MRGGSSPLWIPFGHRTPGEAANLRPEDEASCRDRRPSPRTFLLLFLSRPLSPACPFRSTFWRALDREGFEEDLDERGRYKVANANLTPGPEVANANLTPGPEVANANLTSGPA